MDATTCRIRNYLQVLGGEICRGMDGHAITVMRSFEEVRAEASFAKPYKNWPLISRYAK
jgi:hypothetical protein